MRIGDRRLFDYCRSTFYQIEIETNFFSLYVNMGDIQDEYLDVAVADVKTH